MTTDTIVYMPRWKRVTGLLIFALMTALFLWLFAIKWPLWWAGVQAGDPVIMFYSTAGYLLGGSLFLLVVVIGTAANLWGNTAIRGLWRRSEKGLVIACALIMFLLPWIGNPMIESYLKDHGYTECPAASKHDFRFSRIAYVRDGVACSQGLAGGEGGG